ncbi:hypothetical protein BgiBS90_019570, partial [Biomphalaria glabrata]
MVCVSALVIRSQITNGRLGDKAVLECSRNVSNKPDHMSIMRSVNNYYFVCDTNSLPYNCTTYSLAILGKHERDSSKTGAITMTINRLECSDQGIYECQIVRLNLFVSSTVTSTLTVIP